MARKGGENGQSTPEYVGVVLVVSVLFAASIGLAPGLDVASAIQASLCSAVDARCQGTDDASALGQDLQPGDPPAAATTAREEQLDLLEEALASDLTDFVALKRDPGHDPRMDYSDDGCSAPVLGSKGPFWDFTEPCYRHDFGYRNAKRLGVFDRLKERIDLVFLRDMRDHCATLVFAEHRCRVMASLYFQGVDKLGGRCDLPGGLPRIPGPCSSEHG